MKIQNIELRHVNPSAKNPRRTIDENEITALAESIQQVGLMQPITVRKTASDYEIIAGERRYWAFVRMAEDEIPAIVVDADDNTAAAMRLVENMQRADVDPVEESRAYDQLVNEMGWTVHDLAAKIGRTSSYVHSRMRLHKLPQSVLTALDAGRIKISHAMMIAKLEGESAQNKALQIAAPSYGAPPTLAQLAAHIRDRIIMDLSKTPWDDSTGFSELKCSTCIHRTGCQAQLFDDLSSEDHCLDPECFAQKKNQWHEWMIENLRRDGKNVLPLDANVMTYDFSDVNYGNSSLYALPSENIQTIHSVPVKAKFSQKTFAELAEITDTKPIYAYNPDDSSLTELVDLTELRAKMMEQKMLFPRPEKTSNQQSDWQEVHRKRMQIRKENADKIFNEIKKDSVSRNTALLAMIECEAEDLDRVRLLATVDEEENLHLSASILDDVICAYVADYCEGNVQMCERVADALEIFIEEE